MLPGPVGIYAALVLVLALPTGLAGAVLGRRLRWDRRLQRHGTQWAGRWRLRHLIILSPRPGRITLGRRGGWFGRLLLAVESCHSVLCFGPAGSFKTAGLVIPHHLVRHARVMDHGVGWVNERFGSRALTGFSHGAAGVAWALSQLTRVIGDDRYQETVRAALRYERSLFVPARSNWLDLRDDGAAPPGRPPERCMTAWCHSAPGIGLGRLGLLDGHDDGLVLGEVRAAVSATVREGFHDNQSLCHGDLGNAEFLIAAAPVVADTPARPVAHQAVSSVVHQIEAGTVRCGTPSGVETPGLMTGLAGIGYGLLRLVHPDRVPSVLLLAPPVSA